MEDIEYYKSLVSDDEVISALVKDSKAREGLLEKTRVRPNLQFFQRTVTNLVSSNKRVTEKQEQVKAIEKEKNKVYRPKKVFVRKKLPIEYIREILSNKIDFVKSTEESQSSEVTNNTIELQDKGKSVTMSAYHSHQTMRQRKMFNQKKTPFQQIREILTKNVDESKLTTMKEKDEESKDLKNNGITDTIILSDSDCSDSEESVDTDKNIGFTNFRSRKKQNTLCK